MTTKYTGKKVLYSIITYADGFYLIANLIISFYHLEEYYADDETEHGITESGVHANIRILQCFLSCTVFIKLLYFMQIID